MKLDNVRIVGNIDLFLYTIRRRILLSIPKGIPGSRLSRLILSASVRRLLWLRLQ